MKSMFCIGLLLFCSFSIFAQSPQSFRYQSVVRDAAGTALVNQPVNFQISIISGSITGTVVYSETHTASTNAYGIVTLNVGGGTPVTGTFSSINWGSASHYIKVEADPAGGTNYLDMGTTQLLSVPYSLYSEQAGNVPTYSGGTGIDVTGTTITNTAPDQAVTLTQGGATTITGTYPNFTISSTDNNTTYTAGTGIDVTGTTITNSSPNAIHTGDVTGSTTLTIANNAVTTTKIANGNVTAAKLNPMSATNGQVLKYNGTNWAPATDNNTTYTAGTGINVTGTTITNTAPDQTVSLTQGGATTVSGTYPNFTISSTDLNTGTPGGLNKTVQFNNSGSFGGDTALVWDNTNKRLGVGTSAPLGRVVIKGSSTALATEPLFEIKNKNDQQIMVVYEDSVHFFITDAASPSNRGGFAVSGRNNAKAFTNNYLTVTPDSTRIFTGDTISGFGVENLNGGSSTSYMHLTPYNYFIGHQAGDSTTTGFYNSFIGYQSGIHNTVGRKNYFLGYRSGFNNISGYNNIFIGDSVGYFNSIGYKNVFIGNGSGMSNIDGNHNIFMGFRSGNSNTSGYFNIFIGDRSGNFNTIGTNNVFIGIRNGYSNISGNYNTSAGFEAMYFNTVGEFNTALGFESLFYNDSGSYNTSIGYRTLKQNTTGNSNTAVGMYSLFANTVGIYNTANGSYSLWNNTAGNYNIAVGNSSLYQNSSGSNNTAVGNSSLFNNISGNFLTAIGYNSNVSIDGIANSTAIGALSSVTASDQVRVGSFFVTSIGGYTDWTNISDKRFKKDIKENVPGLDFILKLKPVTYYLDMNRIAEYLQAPDSLRLKESEAVKGNLLQTGFIAQDVEKAANDIGFDFSGVDKPKNEKDYYGLRYAEFTVPLVKAVQEQQAMINKLNDNNELLLKENSEQKILINQLINRIEKMENKIK